MDKILGVDLGTNSIGWAIREINERLENQIVKQGVLLFDKGVATDKGNEFPKVQKRTESRGKRRNYQAEKYRKFKLLEFLINRKMCPLTIMELNEWRQYRKGEKRKYPQSIDFINWLRFDFNGDGLPDFHLLKKDKHDSFYAFRAYSVDQNYKKVFDENPHLLGRVLYQLVQRRGFKGRDEEEAETMLKGSENSGTKGRNDIEEYLSKYTTLGSALYHFQKDKGGRIRQRYNLRKDVENELITICKIHNLAESDFKLLWKAIIWQRPLRNKKGLIGMCAYEKNKQRVALSHPLYQEFKTWVLINNLKIDSPTNEDKSQYLSDVVYPCFIRKSDFKVEDLIKVVERTGGAVNSNFANGKNKLTKIGALENFYDFTKVFGPAWKDELGFNNFYNRDSRQAKRTEKSYDIFDIWHVLKTFDSKEKLFEFGVNKLNLNDEQARIFSNIKLLGGYATLSLSAVKKILPYLKRGINYSTAVYLANLPKVFGQNEISNSIVENFITEIYKIEKRVEEVRKLNVIVNRLIKRHLEDGYVYYIEDNRELDDSEKNLIEKIVISEFGNYTWDSLNEDLKAEKLAYVQKKFKEFLSSPKNSSQRKFLKIPRLHQEIFNYFQRKYCLPEDRIKSLWHPSEQEKYPNSILKRKVKLNGSIFFLDENKLGSFLIDNPEAEVEGDLLNLLGSPEPIGKGFKNPMALKTLHKLKQLINFLLQTNQIDVDTKIVIEIARELNDNNMRAAIKTYQRQRENENDQFSKIIEEINKECKTSYNTKDKTLLTKIRLWKEQSERCIYTGKKINLCDVFDGNKFDLEHTIPVSMSFDSELKNLTISDIDFNRNIKGKRIPYQLSNYDDVKNNVAFMREKFEELDKQIKENIRIVKNAIDKEKKDRLIQKRHVLKFEKDYWIKKYNSFIVKEFKTGWRNSQLVDTQIVTKYAIPYLKTVFKLVSVEKGTVVNDFKRIYNVLLEEKKDRSKHSHHAIDAAILTLIPNSYKREKILEEYYLAREKKVKFHSLPDNWKNFKPSKIIKIEEAVLANNLVDNRTLKPTFKKVRKGGKIQMGLNQRPLISAGDTIRGQLHTETFYGAIKKPLRDEDNKILFDEKNRMILDDEIRMVLRKPLIYKKDANMSGFKTLEEIEKVIVDKALFVQIKNQVGNKRLKDAIADGIWMLDKNGVRVNQIRRIRCYEDSNVKFETALKVHKHTFKSRMYYKRNTYSQNANGSLNYALLYEGYINGKRSRKIKPISLFEIANLKISDISDLSTITKYRSIATSSKDNAVKIPLKTILEIGQKVILYQNNANELKNLSFGSLLKRVYKIYKFESDGRINLINHITSGDKTKIQEEFGKPASKLELDRYQPLLRISQSEWNFIIEGLDFRIQLDGTISFIDS
ncbi:hypothetical protein GYB57_05555 [bacterium]|nr:hypothetical protein [bacterium]